ncbi:hypothetical protein MHC_04740 [Mycoplasma haemocanis str. Illinois]|uniref:Uncharacterized protein n=1 Tax=Mycoplasma haemocanis (strain Illinois) TaxID=1111676 RepID=H6N832_MYCHN|nr:hypothetical protein [Mycoplasma haemocanis]AEW45804.1 hypothetical protein MHC_04740 [Mycoplasma haemocanis str. Illinois]
MASPLVKPLALSALVGASGTGVYLGSKLLESEATPVKENRKEFFLVSELLSKHSTKQLIDKNLGKSHTDWTTAWNNYKTKNNDKTTDGSDPLGISNWSTKRNQSEVPDEFLNRCDEEGKRRVLDTSNSIYLNVLNWCTKDKEATSGVGS